MNQSIVSPINRRSDLIGATATSEAPRELTKGEKVAVISVGLVVLALGILGFVNSFAAVKLAAVPYFGGLAWTLPIGVDLAIGAFSAVEILLARLGMRLSILKLVPWTLTAVTVYLNVAGETNLFGIIAHAVLPGLWVMAVEVIAYAVRRRYKLSQAKNMEAIRLSRWILSPISTFFLWRRSVLWETRSYEAALRRERDRAYAKADLQERYGRMWRLKATRRERVEYKLGELVPTELISAVEEETEEQILPEYTETKNGKRAKAAPTIEELVPVGLEVAEELAKDGQKLTRNNLIERMRERGTGLSTNRANDLLNRLKQEFGTVQAAA
ncbi:DUF2637 domain-containing protein [Nonomuraea wenchangensis]|uniref:DUF2637 domain-containing protein n=1 Tax=Nonomuraea wenchangensis TaxID=568860 RepID=A0A1I0EFJ3_9ACTN|nr:DUF2637 domain-containing protein [Nonomuraea wenchangensis]SET43972.1 Protein of unknown function [Nonomuraea wenchangensis]